ncbi:unnamed protein product, partial [marine sediment metagenome]
MSALDRIRKDKEKRAKTERYDRIMAADAASTKELLEGANPTAGQSFSENLTQGIGQGMSNIGRNVGNMVGLVSDEDLAESDRLDEALLDTGGGATGSFVGEMAALAPLSIPAAGVGTAVKAATKAPRLLKALGATLPKASGA